MHDTDRNNIFASAAAEIKTLRAKLAMALSLK